MVPEEECSQCGGRATQAEPARPARSRARSREGWHWTAHAAALLAVVSSCVVSDPPEYSNAAQTPPLLVLLNADPPVSEVQQLNTGDLFRLNVPVRSEDAVGDELIARLYLDYDLSSEAVQAPLIILAAGSYDNLRNVEMSWQVPPVSPGCKQLMLVVTHRSNLNSSGRPLTNEDTAVAVWWLNLNDTNSDNPMSACPSASVAQ